MLCLWPKFFIYLLGLFESFFFSILFLIFPFFWITQHQVVQVSLKKKPQNLIKLRIISLNISSFTDF